MQVSQLHCLLVHKFDDAAYFSTVVRILSLVELPARFDELIDGCDGPAFVVGAVSHAMTLDAASDLGLG